MKVLNFSKLQQAVVNPIKHYFNETLGIFLNEDKEHVLRFSSKDKYRLSKQALTTPLHKVIERARKEGLFPKGYFGEMEENIFSRLLHEQKESFQEIKAYYTLSLKEDCKEVTFLENGWIEVPALQVGDLAIVGKIEDLSDQGLFSLRKDSFESRFKMWPKLVVTSLLKKKFKELPYPEERLLFLDHLLQFPIDEKHLEAMKDYIAISCPSPLISEWFESFLKGKLPPIESTYHPIYNEYMKLYLAKYKIEDPVFWQQKGESLFCGEAHAYFSL